MIKQQKNNRRPLGGGRLAHVLRGRNLSHRMRQEGRGHPGCCLARFDVLVKLVLGTYNI